MRYGHYTGEVEDSIARLAIVSSIVTPTPRIRAFSYGLTTPC